MDVKLDEIIDKIKTEGVNKGKEEASSLVSQAKSEAQSIIDDARTQAKQIIQQAAQQSESIVTRGTSALQQAKRDLLLVVKEQLASIIASFAQKNLAKALSTEATIELIKVALSKWNFQSNKSLFVHVSKEDAQKISAAALHSAGTIEIKVDEQLSKGFRISSDEQGSLQYDFSETAINEALTHFLTQNIQELLQ